MMSMIFLLMFFALVLGLFGWRIPALICVTASFGLTVNKFLWAVHNAEYGYSMPWLQF